VPVVTLGCTMIHTVIQFIDADISGGSEEVVMQLVAGLDRSRWRSMLFHHGSTGMTRLVDYVSRSGIACRAVPRITKWNVSRTLRHIIRELRTVQPTILHAHLNWPLDCRDAVIAATLARVPAVVATSHLYCPILRGRFGWLRQRVQTACVDRYIAVSDEVKRRLGQNLQVPESKIRVVRNGICTARFDNPADPALRASLVDGQKRPVVFTPARLNSQKGHSYLLKAAALVPEGLFVLAGDGPERRPLEEMTRALGLQERIRFLGHRQDIPQLFACCDLFVLPSLFEGLPLSILEAMAAGKPIVATAVGGSDEAIVDGVTGLLVPPADPVSLAAAIRRLLSDRELASRLATAAKTRVTREFSSDAMVRGVTGVYEELITQAQPIAQINKDASECVETRVEL
jgi:glycosyltransferase involved in cell wall biosynthesis